MTKHHEVLAWRSRGLRPKTAEKLAEAMTVEGLPYERIPASMYSRVVAFRHLRGDARLRACRSFLAARPA